MIYILVEIRQTLNKWQDFNIKNIGLYQNIEKILRLATRQKENRMNLFKNNKFTLYENKIGFLCQKKLVSMAFS